MYLLRIPKPVQWLFNRAQYNVPHSNRQVYLTFDDGPIPEVTPWVLAQLEKYNASATFFMVGDNVAKYPDIYNAVIAAGHRVGNHTYHHVKGTVLSTAAYLADIEQASKLIDSSLFRPPYGLVRPAQARAIHKSGLQLCFWSLLSGDFDMNLSADQCLHNVIDNIRPGDVVVFHDSIKAWPRLSYVLPKVLEFCNKQGWTMRVMP